MTDTVDEFLEHFGVKGMKWGVRNDRGHEGERAKTKTITKLDKKYEKTFSGSGGWIKVHNAFAQSVNSRLGSLNDKYDGIDISVTGSKNQKDYLRDYEKLIDNAATEMTNSFGTNASGTKRLKVSRHGEGYDSTWSAEFEDLKHAEEDDFRLEITPTFNSKGFIVSQKIEVVNKTLKQFDKAENFLEHFGIKGMRWGRRKDSGEPTDVSYTLRSGKKVQTKGGTNQPATEDAIRTAVYRQKAKASTTDALTTQQLQEAVNRMNLEQQYSRLTTANVSPGRKFVNELLMGAAKQNATRVVNEQANQFLKKKLG